MSAGVEKRPMGMVARNFARISGVSSPMKDARSGVSPATGASAFTRMPEGASSTAIASVAVIIQPLEALYQLRRGRGETPAVEATLRIAPVFRWLGEAGGLEPSEVLKTFNAGIGMVLVVAPERAAALETLLRGAGETVFRIGQIEAGEGVRYRGTLL